MGWQHSHAAPGPRLSSLLTCSPTWSGGERIIILYAPMLRCEWHWPSHKNEEANVWLNATGSGRQRWQQEEQTDDGPRQKCCLILYQNSARLEKGASMH